MRIFLLLFVGYIIFFLFEYIFRKQWKKHLSISLNSRKDYLYEGEKIELEEEIKNQKFLPIPAIKIKFAVDRSWIDLENVNVNNVTDQYYRNDLLSVGSYEQIQRNLKFTCSKRGYYVLGDVDVFVSNFFFNREYVFRIKKEQWVYVFPRRCHSKELEFVYKNIIGEIYTRRNLLEDPFSFAGIRDYQSYDGMNKVNWKASAKTGRLKVNRLESTTDISIHIVLYFQEHNGFWDSEIEEYLIRLAATMAESFLKDGIQVALSSNGCDVETKMQVGVKHGAGEHHIESIDRGLARIDLSQGGSKIIDFTSIFEEEKDLVILLTDCQSENFMEQLTKAVPREKSFFWILPYYRSNIIAIKEDLRKNVITICVEES
ncbi:MAG: DUF58 domain-containing protein [Lachnospiraceae bacterium]|nr:DUF58 domain-containing protein [Lachnospiraceae bacterium]